MGVLCMGNSRRGGSALRALVPFFGKGTYDAIYKNCNAFTDAAAYFLTGSRLEARFSRLERLVQATKPISLGLINRLLQRSAQSEAHEEDDDDTDDGSTSEDATNADNTVTTPAVASNTPV